MFRSLNQQIKAHIHDSIEAGVWKVGEQIPSESQLARQFSAARMTVNRALNELALEQRITRVQGVGSFVARRMPQAPLFEIQSIRTEIESRGARHSCRVLALDSRAAGERTARRMEVPAGSAVFYLEALHLSDGTPLQLERRFVRPECAPDFLAQDFTRETASDFLVRTVPYATLEHVVTAIAPPPEVAEKLEIAPGAPCLQLSRKTMGAAGVITDVDLIHPGASFRMSGTMQAGDLPRQTAS